MLESLSIVIPSYHDRARLLPTLGEIHASTSQGELRGRRTEIIVVENGIGEPNEADLSLEGVLQRIPNLQVLSLREKGKGIAMKTGVLSATGDLILTLDADAYASIPPDESLGGKIDVYLRYYNEHRPNILIGKRPSPLRRGGNRWRQFLASGARITINALGLGSLDPTHPMKLYETPSAQDLFAEVTISGFAFDLEMLYLAKRRKLRIDSIDSGWQYASGSTFSMIRDLPRMLYYSLSIPIRHALTE